MRTQLKAQQIELEVSQAAKDHVIKLGYDVDYGARPLRRVIQNMIEDPWLRPCWWAASRLVTPCWSTARRTLV